MKLLTPRIALVATLAILLSGCATSDPVTPPGGAGAGGASGPENRPQGEEDGICLLNNCSADAHCSACGENLHTCLLSENRCVACDRETGEGCPEGQACSAYGKCVPEGLTCPVDAHGTPTVTCDDDADCAACDPQHQACDLARGRCVACTEDNTRACQSTDSCVDGACLANCPATCDRDSDCANCGSAQREAHACHAHRCAECSATMPCPDGEVCTPQGVCEPACGMQGISGLCQSDADCAGCGPTASKCHLPINGGNGSCGPPAAGCSDLAANVAVLPAPFDQVTNLCSNDNDCAGVGITLNVGKMLRDLTNISSIDDANITYGMNRCADVTIAQNSCGACVPCKVDSDCAPIDVDQVALDAFGPLGSLAAAFLLDQVFGPSDHKIHMYCDVIAGDYGACVPCPNWLSSCSTGGFSGGGSCNHDVCQVGGPLHTSCSSCAQSVCNLDPYCCTNSWDSVCVQEAQQLCGAGCQGTGSQCVHDECASGGALSATCSSCAQSVCNADPFCCTNSWDALCVQQAEQLCPGKSCGGQGPACAHDECQSGDALSPSCSSCAGVVCNVDPYCCSTAWDSICAQQADQYCAGKSCGMGSGCAHDECSAGPALGATCSSCAQAVCNADSYCCTTEWDSVCVGLTDLYCPNKGCGSSSGGCAHDPCSPGAALGSTCSSCVQTVCASDPFCCSTQWDALCVEQADQTCGLSCGGGTSTAVCEHDECQTGVAMTNGCSSCVSTVCGADPYCCDTDWDATCVEEAEDWCSLSCGSTSACAHDECAYGGPLTASCSSCTQAVCSADPYCCNTAWDQTCVEEVDWYCSFTCL